MAQRSKLEWTEVIFVNSMSDLFHKDIPLEFLQKVFEVEFRKLNAGNTYQIKVSNNVYFLFLFLTFYAIPLI